MPVFIQYQPEHPVPLAEIYSEYSRPSPGLSPFPPEHWEALFSRPELNPRKDVIILADPDNQGINNPVAFCWLYAKHAPSHVYLRGPYLSTDRADTPRLIDMVLEEVIRRANEYNAGYVEGRSIYKKWEDAYSRAGFRCMGAYERWRLFPLRGSIPVHDIPPGGNIREWQGMSDIPVLMDLFANSFEEHWDYVPPRRRDYEEIVRGSQFSPELLLIAFESDTPVAFIFGEGMYDYSLPTMNGAYLVSVAVNSESRSKGWGRALLSRWLRAVYNSGGRAVELDVDGENHYAKALYQSFGFRRLRIENVWRKYLGNSDVRE